MIIVHKGVGDSPKMAPVRERPTWWLQSVTSESLSHRQTASQESRRKEEEEMEEMKAMERAWITRSVLLTALLIG